MKKVIFGLIILLSFFSICLAKEPAKLVYLTNRCSVVKDKETTIHIEVISTNEGDVVKLTDRFIMGRITNTDDINISFSNVESDYITQVILDTLRDENSRSNLNVYFDKDINLNKGEKLLSFNINIEFQGDVPSSLYVLGNEVLLSKDESICESINGYKTEVIKTETKVKENMNFYYIIGGLLIAIVLMEFVIILINKNKR